MPKGKSYQPITIITQSYAHAFYAISISRMRRYAKNRQKKLEKNRIKNLRADLRFAFRLYLASQEQQNLVQTTTERKNELNRYKLAAQKFYKSLDENSLVSIKNHGDVLYDLFCLNNPNVKQILYKSLDDPVCEVRDLKQLIIKSYTGQANIKKLKLILKKIINFDADDYYFFETTNPDLRKLFWIVLPIWREVTDRSFLPSMGYYDSDIRDYDRYYFKVWLDECLQGLSLPLLKTGTIVDTAKLFHIN